MRIIICVLLMMILNKDKVVFNIRKEATTLKMKENKMCKVNEEKERKIKTIPMREISLLLLFLTLTPK